MLKKRCFFTELATVTYRPYVHTTLIGVSQEVMVTSMAKVQSMSLFALKGWFTKDDNCVIIYPHVSPNLYDFYLSLNTKSDTLKNVHAALLHTVTEWMWIGLPSSNKHETKAIHTSSVLKPNYNFVNFFTENMPWSPSTIILWIRTA